MNIRIKERDNTGMIEIKLSLWIATDRNGTKIYSNKPWKNHQSPKDFLWEGKRQCDYSYLPKDFKQKEGDCKKIIFTATI